MTDDRYPEGNYLVNATDGLASGWAFPSGGSDRDLAFIFVFGQGPDANNTQTMVYLNAFDVNSALTHRTMVIAESLSYDCSIFDANDICVSWGGRYGNSGNSITNGAGVLTVAYRFLPEFYVGAFVDQSAPMDYGTSIRSTGMDPTFGGFLVWQENPDQSGFRVRLSAAHHNGNVRITREASLTNTEGGRARQGCKAGVMELIFPMGSTWMRMCCFRPMLAFAAVQRAGKAILKNLGIVSNIR